MTRNSRTTTGHRRRKRRRNATAASSSTRPRSMTRWTRTTSGRTVPMRLALSMRWTRSDRRHVKSKFVDAATCGSKCTQNGRIKTRIITRWNELISCSTQKEDEIEEYLRKRYADESLARRHFGDGGEEMSNEITQQTLLPAIK